VVNCCVRYSDLAPVYPLPQEGDYEAGHRRAPACLHAAAAELYFRARSPLTDAMITFIHLSDIHFSPRDDLSQFDLDQQIRRAVLEDLEQKHADGARYDGLLITGDIAYGGKQDDYKKAQQFLDEVFTRTGASATTTYM